MSFNMEDVRNQYQTVKRRIEAIEASVPYQQIIRDQDLIFQIAIARPNSALYRGLQNEQDLGEQLTERFKSLKQKLQDNESSPLFTQLREDRAFVQEVETKLPEVSAPTTIPDGVCNVLERAMSRRARRNRSRRSRREGMRAESNYTHTTSGGTSDSVLEGLPLPILQQIFEAIQNSPAEPRPDPLFFHHILQGTHNSAAEPGPGPLPRRGSYVRERPTPDWVQHIFQPTQNSSAEPSLRRGGYVRERPAPAWDFS